MAHVPHADAKGAAAAPAQYAGTAMLSRLHCITRESLRRAEQGGTYSVKSSPATVQLRFVMTHVLSCTKPALQAVCKMLTYSSLVAVHGWSLSVHDCHNCSTQYATVQPETDEMDPALVKF